MLIIVVNPVINIILSFMRVSVYNIFLAHSTTNNIPQMVGMIKNVQ